MSPAAHYSVRILLTLAFGLTIFLPQVESTFVSLLRRGSPIGAKYVDRSQFACPNCGTVNQPIVRFCVRCGTPISPTTRFWGPGVQPTTALLPVLKSLLVINAILAFFIGLFDLTLFSYLTMDLGLSPTVVLLATILSTVPSLAAYMALKEGPLRRFGTMRRFDRLVYSDVTWILFGTLFLLLAAASFLILPQDTFGNTLVAWIQLIAGVLMLLHVVLRKRVTSIAATPPPTLTYPQTPPAPP